MCGQSGSKYGPGDKSDKYRSVHFSDKDSKHNRDNRGSGGSILAPYSLLHITCTCDDTDIDTMYRRCCISTSDSSSSLPVTTLFDTGANPTSFVNRQVAAWIELQSATPSASIFLAGTSLTSPIYGTVVFDLTFVNEVTRANERLFSLHAKVIDNCIDVIVSRPVIREHHFVQKIPHETTSSKPYLSQSVTPVTSSLARVSCICAHMHPICGTRV